MSTTRFSGKNLFSFTLHTLNLIPLEEIKQNIPKNMYYLPYWPVFIRFYWKEAEPNPSRKQKSMHWTSSQAHSFYAQSFHSLDWTTSEPLEVPSSLETQLIFSQSTGLHSTPLQADSLMNRHIGYARSGTQRHPVNSLQWGTFHRDRLQCVRALPRDTHPWWQHHSKPTISYASLLHDFLTQHWTLDFQQLLDICLVKPRNQNLGIDWVWQFMDIQA